MYDIASDGYIGGHNPVIMKREEFLTFIRAAEEADYEKGYSFEPFFAQEKNPRVCALNGMTLEDMFKPGFAAVVISEDK